MNVIRLGSSMQAWRWLPRSIFGRGWRILASAWRRIAFVHARQRQRMALGRLDERLLRDVGLTADQARDEAAKPPWRD